MVVRTESNSEASSTLSVLTFEPWRSIFTIAMPSSFTLMLMCFRPDELAAGAATEQDERKHSLGQDTHSACLSKRELGVQRSSREASETLRLSELR